MGSSWLNSKINPQKVVESITATQALVNFCKKMNIAVDESSLVESTVDGVTVISGASFADDQVKVNRKYYRTATTAEMAYELVVPMTENYFNAFVSISSGRVLAVSDWNIADSWVAPTSANTLIRRDDEPTADPSTTPSQPDHSASSENPIYQVIAFPNEDPYSPRSVVSNPADPNASPLGWHNVGKGPVSTSTGNNVDVQNLGTSSVRRPESKTFDFQYQFDDFNKTPDQYWEASASNLFYVNNFVHDVSYNYGFDEASGNFQANNFDKGGRANDFVVANNQDRTGTNNANFATPPDGTLILI